jgi:hypothetical protein
MKSKNIISYFVQRNILLLERNLENKEENKITKPKINRDYKKNTLDLLNKDKISITKVL